jgi:exonuclease 3'-5' domain-containing protein 1
MSADAAQKAILYFVELLMNSNGALSISQLAGHFGDRAFTPEMRTAAGSNEAGLKKLLLKYPSLFSICGNQVSLYGTLDDDNIGQSGGADAFPDVTAEMAAVHYFRSKLMPKGNRWVEIKSLAGHLSQASPDIRALVGPQVEFGKWLSRHTHIFEVRDTSVRLQRDVLADSFMAREDSDNDSVCSSLSFSGDLTKLDADTERRRFEGPRMTKQEQKMVWLIKDLVKAKGSIDLNSITNQLAAHAPIELLGIGERVDPVRTIRKYPGIFKISENNCVSLGTNASSNSTSRRHGDRNRKDERVALMACSGPVYHLSKLWGIIDLGLHEHVFFDQSIMEQPSVDLRVEYQVGDIVYFDAVRAPKSSRAKWKAVRVWKVVEDEAPSSTDGFGTLVGSNCSVRADELKSANASPASSLSNAKLKLVSAGDDTSKIPFCESFLQPVDSTAEQMMLNNNWRNADFILSPVSGEDEDDVRSLAFGSAEQKRYVDAECQTISTGDIIATQFYFSE